MKRVLFLFAILSLVMSSASYAYVERIDRTTDAAEIDGRSGGPDVSSDGRYTAFHSEASNLVPGDYYGVSDIFVYDRDTDTVERVSVSTDPDNPDPDGESLNPAISADGRYVAFQSVATNLVAGDVNGTCDIFVYDRVEGTTRLVSVSTDGVQGNGPSTWPDISGDGDTIAFESLANNLVTGDDNGESDVFAHYIPGDITYRVSRVFKGDEGTGPGGSYQASINGNGSRIAFTSDRSFSHLDDNSHSDIYVAGDSGVYALVSVNDAWVCGNGESYAPSISDSGDIVAFESIADNLSDADDPDLVDVFARNVKAETTEFVSTSAGLAGNGDSIQPCLGEGTGSGVAVVAFESYATNLHPSANNGVGQILVKPLGGHTITRCVSTGSSGQPGDGDSTGPAVSLGGGTVAFVSAASNLVAGDENGFEDVFYRRSHILVTGSAEGQPGDTVGVPITLLNESVSDIGYVAMVFEYDTLAADNPVVTAGPDLSGGFIIPPVYGAGVVTITLGEPGGTTPLADGVVANVGLHILPDINSDPDRMLAVHDVSASDTSGAPVFVAGSEGTLRVLFNPTVTVIINFPGTGTVEVSPEGPYELGDTVTLTPVPDTCNKLVYLSSDNYVYDVTGGSETYELVLDDSTTVNARFEGYQTGPPAISVLTDGVASGEGGTVTSDPSAETYLCGDVVTLTAVPNEGYYFANWSGDVSVDGSSPLTATATADGTGTAVASFTSTGYTLFHDIAPESATVTAVPEGPYGLGDVVDVTVSAANCFSLDGRQVTGASVLQESTDFSSAQLKLSVEGDMNLNADLTRKSFPLGVSVLTDGEALHALSGGMVGVVPPAHNGNWHYCGDTVTLTASTNEGFVFGGWSSNDIPIAEPDNPVLVFDMNDYVEVTAAFDTRESSSGPGLAIEVAEQFGRVCTIKATYTPPEGESAERVVVRLMRSMDGGTDWGYAGRGRTDADGVAYIRYRLREGTNLIKGVADFGGRGTEAGSVTSNTVEREYTREARTNSYSQGKNN